MNEQESIDYDQPVAYDAEGRPLYAHPPKKPEASPFVPTPAAPPQSARIQRPDPTNVTSPEEQNALHLASREKYPGLNLSAGEYVIEEIRRNPAGLVPTVTVIGLAVAGCLTVLFIYPLFERTGAPAFNTILLPMVMIIILLILIGYAAVTIYNSNRFFLTNESVIEEVQTTLFARKERTVSLASIEEVTFRQDSLLQNIFGYGTVQMTIEGHTVYDFPYIGNPKQKVDLLVNSIEKMKFNNPGHGH